MRQHPRTEGRRLVKAEEAARLLDTTVAALKADRHSPFFAVPFVRLGRRAIRYDLEALQDLIAERTVKPEQLEAARRGAS